MNSSEGRPKDEVERAVGDVVHEGIEARHVCITRAESHK